MRCLVSDDTGLIKVVNLDGKGKVVQTMGQQSKERRVASLCWAAPDESMVAAGCKDGVIRLWRPADGSAAGEIETGEEDLVSVRMITRSGVCTLVSAHKGGKCGAWRLDEDNEVDSCLFDVPGPVTVMDTSVINGTVLFGGKVTVSHAPGSLLHLDVTCCCCRSGRWMCGIWRAGPSCGLRGTYRTIIWI